MFITNLRRRLVSGVLCVGGAMLCASMVGCDGQEGGGVAMSKTTGAKGPQDASKPPALERVVIAGKAFKLEPVLDDETRFKGLSGRTEIAADGGMIFVFKEPRLLEFVMRDCLIAIDIIYVDAAGRVTAMHKMVPEAPRGEDEKQLKVPFPTAPAWAGTNEKYEKRLKQYSSKFAAQFAIELKGGTLDGLTIKVPDKIELDRVGLKKRAK